MGQRMLGIMGKYGCYSSIGQLTISTVTVHLSSSHAEMLNNYLTDASGYIRRRFGSTLEGALKEKSVRGERVYV